MIAKSLTTLTKCRRNADLAYTMSVYSHWLWGHISNAIILTIENRPKAKIAGLRTRKFRDLQSVSS